MNAQSFSHWGLVTFPDNDRMVNIVIGGDGDLSRFDNDREFTQFQTSRRVNVTVHGRPPNPEQWNG